jgi:hypothetical protein
VFCKDFDTCGGLITCGTGPCTVSCMGAGSCAGGVVCDQACSCEVECKFTSTCTGGVTCPTTCAACGPNDGCGSC